MAALPSQPISATRLLRASVALALGLCGCQLLMDPHTGWDNPKDPALSQRTGMRVVEPGRFALGSFGGLSADVQETTYLVDVSGFLMDTAEVSQSLYRRLVGSLPEGNEPDCPTCPVVSVTWYDAVRMCNLRSVAEGFESVYTWDSLRLDSGRVTMLSGLRLDPTKNGYRLPFEVEWERAARGGTDGQAWPWGNDSSAYDRFAWARSNASYQKRPVGSLRPNGFGLYDMAGNVWEWVWDNHAPYDSFQRQDPRGPKTGTSKVIRGGSAGDMVSSLACAKRVTQPPTNRTTMIGFRCARNLIR